MMFSRKQTELARRLIQQCTERGQRIATAESCTGGLLAALITSLLGASAVLDRGFVTYSNEAKCDMLNVAMADIERFGAVSEKVAIAMAEGALKAAMEVTAAVSITGIAGPGGGSESKPVGTVHIACAMEGVATLHEHHRFDGERDDVRMASVEAALRLLLKQLG